MKDELAAAADVLLHNVEQSTRGGMRLILKLKDVAELKEFEQITRFKNGHAGGIYMMLLVGDDWRWSGEVMFQGWSASHTGGAKLRFLLNDEQDVKFLMALERGTAASMGMREMDDEGLVDEARKEKVETERGGPLSKRAAQLCRDPAYQSFLGAATHKQFSEEECAQFIRTVCNVPSRAKLDHDSQAARLFKSLILAPYVEHMYRET